MCIGTPGAQKPAPPPPAPRPIPVEDLTAKTADVPAKAGPKKNKKSSFRRSKSGGRSTSAAAKALNLTPTKKTS
jgi:hypothetical protein